MIAVPVPLARARPAERECAHTQCGPTSPPPPLRDSIGGPRSLSGSGIVNHRGQLRRPDLPSSLPSEGPPGVRGAVVGRGPATGEWGGVIGGRGRGRGGGGSPNPPSPLPGAAQCFLEHLLPADGGEGSFFLGGGVAPQEPPAL